MSTSHHDMSGGRLFVFTGDGKGKTTTAVGHCIRAKSRGLSVLFAQFMKTIEGGETDLLRQVSVDVIRFESVLSPHFHPDLDPVKNRSEALNALETLRSMLPKYDLAVLDEFNNLLNRDIITTKEAVAFLKAKPASLDLIITGRGAPQEIIDIADLVTRMESVKHPAAKGAPAREGIDY